jgi:hypothetical protein
VPEPAGLQRLPAGLQRLPGCRRLFALLPAREPVRLLAPAQQELSPPLPPAPAGQHARRAEGGALCCRLQPPAQLRARVDRVRARQQAGRRAGGAVRARGVHRPGAGQGSRGAGHRHRAAPGPGGRCTGSRAAGGGLAAAAGHGARGAARLVEHLQPDQGAGRGAGGFGGPGARPAARHRAPQHRGGLLEGAPARLDGGAAHGRPADPGVRQGADWCAGGPGSLAVGWCPADASILHKLAACQDDHW